jgi:hypothetical protein
MFWDLEKNHQRVSRLRENVKATSLQLPPETVAKRVAALSCYSVVASVGRYPARDPDS